MAIDLQPLFDDAFYAEEVQNASESFARALEKYEATQHVGARPFEVVVPDEPDEQWVREGLLQPLIYFCDSEGAVMPNCGGVVVLMFVGSQLYGIVADRVVRWASELLHVPPEQLTAQYGTHEVDTGVR